MGLGLGGIPLSLHHSLHHHGPIVLKDEGKRDVNASKRPKFVLLTIEPKRPRSGGVSFLFVICIRI